MNVNERVQNILNSFCNKETIRLQDHLQNDLGMDSLNMVMLLIELEETFQIQIHESDMNPFDLTTVESVVQLVQRYQGEGNEKD